MDPFARLAWLARRIVEPAWLLDPCVSLLVLLAEWSILLENYCRAGCVRTPERGASPAFRNLSSFNHVSAVLC